MSVNVGLDIDRGRPLPAIGTTEAKLQQRKLDALRRGVHRIQDHTEMPFGIHLVGIGGAGCRVIEEFLSTAPENLLDKPGSRFTALAIDVGDDDLLKVRTSATRFPEERTQVETVALDMASSEELQEVVGKYADFLKLEYPMYHPNPGSTSWLPSGKSIRAEDGSMTRAGSKALYGQAYYDADRPMQKALKRFVASVEKTGGNSIVCIVFGLVGGTGSGIAMDLARHLSSVQFGRRVLVTGLGIAPHPDEVTPDKLTRLHAVFSELDVLCDETKNAGITLSCGDLFKNPFTAGFMIIPQPANVSVSEAREEVSKRLAKLIFERRGANVWEALRLLNWVAAPSTQHSAARTPWGSRWIHMIGSAPDGSGSSNRDLRKDLGLLEDYQPEFLELRTSGTIDESERKAWTEALDSAFSPEAPTCATDGGSPGIVQYLLPRLALKDLSVFEAARNAYDEADPLHRQSEHALLLDQGIVLCEPSTAIEGMAGASLGGGTQWIAVPRDQLRGEYA
ncbi:tubulin-like doman-containing protein [Rhizobium sp. YJ-22]|uniref:tubulin-like doman-containing protein n=1 Tax=Rhizobium sp. YJ-22 TaxID=3037556 RepID=UPI0024129F90|nr:tubulin-like doman-containing protein [Rhizobium sp. YJ-22]MDG3580482.1 tubulin-like doman-containing protein [Rhizobium sp. YJ-22]